MQTDTQNRIVSGSGGSAPASRSAVAGEASPSQVISSDFETFLRMLTTQLENQDPLNPIESQDFAVQLATFSGVEQQVLTNDLIRDLKGALGASDLAQLAGWVGMDARVSAPALFEGRPIDLAIAPQPGTDRAELVVRDGHGVEVARERVQLTPGTFGWAGTAPDGDPLASGQYTFEVESFAGGELIGVTAAPHYARVTEARLGPDGVELVLKGGSVVQAESVSGLRQPEAPLQE